MIDRAYLDKLVQSIHELETELSKPETSSDQKLFQKLMAEYTHHKKLREHAELFLKLRDEKEEGESILQSADADADFKELAEAELERVRRELPEAERALMIAFLPPDPVASRNIIMEIRAGTGGDEAALFAGDLYRMYTRYAETQSWKTGMLDASPTNLGGFKEIIFSVEGEGVYKKLQFESGGHRVQRIPVTEASGRIHTSAATVAVLPEADPVDDIEIKPEEIRIDIFRSSGPGGQSVNTTDSAVRITHLETGIVVQSQDERSQHRNKDKAMRVLMARLLDHKRQEENEKMADERRTQIGSGDRSQRIRTYNFPQNRITDHRINLTMYNLDRAMEGEIGELLEAIYAHDLDLRLEREVGELKV